jgi:hypothetical protein
MAINFPTSPTTNDIWTENDRSWKFNGTSWDGLPIPSGSGIITYTPAGTGAVDTVVETKLRESVSVKDFGAVGDGVANDRMAIFNALAAHSNVYLPAGTYKVTVDNAVSTGLYIGGAGRTLHGDGENTKIIFDVTDTGYKNLLTSGRHFYFGLAVS